jgi:hypothetical protein
VSAKGHDLERIRRDVSILSLLPGGTKVIKAGSHHWRAQCPLHGGDGLSLGIWLGQWGWSFTCFACNEKGQVIDFAMKLHGITFKAAVERLGGGTLEAAPRMPAWSPPKKAYVLPCIGRGCGARLEVDVTDLPWLGEGLHNSWTFKQTEDDVRARCPKCTRLAAFQPSRDQRLLALCDRLIFIAIETGTQRHTGRMNSASGAGDPRRGSGSTRLAPVRIDRPPSIANP